VSLPVSSDLKVLGGLLDVALGDTLGELLAMLFVNRWHFRPVITVNACFTGPNLIVPQVLFVQVHTIKHRVRLNTL